MITDLPDFDSVNKLNDLPQGRYVVVESVYLRDGRSPMEAVLTEMVTLAENKIVCVDLQVMTVAGELRFRDFCLTPSGSWRDSYGATAFQLRDLLPSELSDCVLTLRRGTFVHHDGSGNLTYL